MFLKVKISKYHSFDMLVKKVKFLMFTLQAFQSNWLLNIRSWVRISAWVEGVSDLMSNAFVNCGKEMTKIFVNFFVNLRKIDDEMFFHLKITFRFFAEVKKT
jgi:hypothetical protein